MAFIPISGLISGQTYKIEVPNVAAICEPIIRGGNVPMCGGKEFSSFTVGVFVGQTVEDENPDGEDPDGEDPDGEDPDGNWSDWSKAYFSIHNYNGPDDQDKNVLLSGTVTYLHFQMTSDFDPWDRNVLLSNVTSWQKSRKWRPSRCHEIYIPVAIAAEDMVFYAM